MLKNIGVKSIHGPLFADSIEIAHQYNLLATDAAHVAAMKKENLVNLATNDADFSRVQFLHLWRLGIRINRPEKIAATHGTGET